MTLTTMGMSTNAMEIGSLMYQDPMEFVENNQVHKNENGRNNGAADTLEIFFTNTEGQLEDNNRINGLEQTENLNRILPNTSTNCMQQAAGQQSFIDVQQQNNRNQYSINITSTGTENNHQSIISAPLHYQIDQQQFDTSNNTSKIYIEQVNNNNNSSSNNNSPNIMYQETFDDCLFDFLPDCNQFANKEDDKNDDQKNVSPTGWDPLASSMEREETFEITHKESEMILTSTQEMIIANGISTEDFTAFENTPYDDRGLIAETSVVGDFDNVALKHEKVDLSDDPMISLPLELLQVKPAVKCESPESPILLDDDSTIVDMETDTIAAEQFINLLKHNDSYQEKVTTNSIYSGAIRKLKRLPQLKLDIPSVANASEETDLTTAQVVNTIFSWDNDVVDANSPFENNSTPPPSNKSNVAGQQHFVFEYEDVTQTSIISSNTSRYDDSTAPPTPFSTISYDASVSGIERKRRGRPPKSHSTQPDPETLKRLAPTEQRYLMQRYKNNEASRQSRLNRKTKQEQQKEEETVQIEKNERLRMELARWEKKEAALKGFLRQIVH